MGDAMAGKSTLWKSCFVASWLAGSLMFRYVLRQGESPLRTGYQFTVEAQALDWTFLTATSVIAALGLMRGLRGRAFIGAISPALVLGLLRYTMPVL